MVFIQPWRYIWWQSCPDFLLVLCCWNCVHDLLLLTKQPPSSSNRICYKPVPCVKQLLLHRSMPQPNPPISFLEHVKVTCTASSNTQPMHCILTKDGNHSCLTALLYILCLTHPSAASRCIYTVPTGENTVCFCVQRPQQRNHNSRDVTRATKILFLCSQLVTKLLGGHSFVFFLRAGNKDTQVHTPLV